MSGDHEFVVLAHGESVHLRDCMRSLQAQTLPTKRISIYTSTPSAHHERVAQEFGVDLRVRPTPGNIGENWNTALGGATAQYVTLAHQDDVYDAAYLAKLLPAMQSVDDGVIGFTGFTECDEVGVRGESFNTRVKRYLINRAFGGSSRLVTASDKHRLLAWGNPICCPSVMYNRANLQNFRFREDLSSNLDWDAWTSLAAEGGTFVYAPEVLVAKRAHRASETASLISNNRRAVEDLFMFNRHWPAPVARAIASIYRLSYVANKL